MFVTSKLLRSKKACENQVEKFASEWPSGCEVTEEVAPARKAYLDAIAPAFAAACRVEV